MPTERIVGVLSVPVVNHAMAHNGLPFLHRLVVSSSAPLTGVLITAGLPVQGGGGDRRRDRDG